MLIGTCSLDFTNPEHMDMIVNHHPMFMVKNRITLYIPLLD